MTDKRLITDRAGEGLAQQPLFEVRGLRGGYGGLDILQGIDIMVDPGEIVCIVGPNGSGKSTLFKAIYGFARITGGSVHFRGEDITGVPPDQLLQSGIAMVPQLAAIFPSLTVQENLELGMYTVRDRRRVRQRVDEVLELFPHLAELRSRRAGVLSGGERRALEIVRALMLDPDLVLVDEPSAGLSPALTTKVFERIAELNQMTGLAFLLIEQNARQGLEASERAYVMEMGTVPHTGPSHQLLHDETVRAAFFPDAVLESDGARSPGDAEAGRA